MTKPARRTLDPKLDVVFKLLFAHPASKSPLISLLTAVLRPAVEIVDVEVLNPDMPRQDAADKGIVLDLRVRLADGRLIDVEMQSQWRSGSRKRFLFYWAKGFITQLQRGDDYAKLEPVSSWSSPTTASSRASGCIRPSGSSRWSATKSSATTWRFTSSSCRT